MKDIEDIATFDEYRAAYVATARQAFSGLGGDAGLEHFAMLSKLEEAHPKFLALMQTPQVAKEINSLPVGQNDARAAMAGIPRRIRDFATDPDQTAAIKRVDRWRADSQSSADAWCLVLSASKGLGKSVAAGYAAQGMLAGGGRAVVSYWDSRDRKDKTLPSWWSISSFARLGGFDGRFDAICKHPGLIVLDDLGAEYLDAKGWFHQALDAFIDERYCEYRPTIITTNLSATDFKARYSERICDRLREGGAFYEFRGESMRV